MFFLAVDEVVLVLHCDEFRPAIALCDILKPLELPCVHCASSNVASFPRLHNVMKSLHDFLHRRESVEPVNLVEVNVIEAKTFEAVVDFRHYVFA